MRCKPCLADRPTLLNKKKIEWRTDRGGRNGYDLSCTGWHCWSVVIAVVLVVVVVASHPLVRITGTS